MMFSLKSILLSIIIILSFPSIAVADDASIDTDTIGLILKQCYEVENKTNMQLAPCMLEKLNEIPNPENYRVRLDGESPGVLSLIIYNPRGIKIICSVSAQKKIEIRRCIATRTASL